MYYLILKLFLMQDYLDGKMKLFIQLKMVGSLVNQQIDLLKIQHMVTVEWLQQLGLYQLKSKYK